MGGIQKAELIPTLIFTFTLFGKISWNGTISPVENPVPNITAENAPASPEGESRGRAKVAEGKNKR